MEIEKQSMDIDRIKPIKRKVKLKAIINNSAHLRRKMRSFQHFRKSIHWSTLATKYPSREQFSLNSQENDAETGYCYVLDEQKRQGKLGQNLVFGGEN